MQLALERKIAAGGGMGRLLGGQATQWRCAHCQHAWRGGMFAGGTGESVEDAVVIRGVSCTAVGIRCEMHYLTERFGLDSGVAGAPEGWRKAGQRLVTAPEGRAYDVITVQHPDGSTRPVYFEVTAFFGQWP